MVGTETCESGGGSREQDQRREISLALRSGETQYLLLSDWFNGIIQYPGLDCVDLCEKETRNANCLVLHSVSPVRFILQIGCQKPFLTFKIEI